MAIENTLSKFQIQSVNAAESDRLTKQSYSHKWDMQQQKSGPAPGARERGQNHKIS